MEQAYSAIPIGYGGSGGGAVVKNSDLNNEPYKRPVYDAAGNLREDFDPNKIGGVAGMKSRLLLTGSKTRDAFAVQVIQDLFDSVTPNPILVDGSLVSASPRSVDLVVIGDNPRLTARDLPNGERYSPSSLAIKEYLVRNGAGKNLKTVQVVMGCPGGQMAGDVAAQLVRAGYSKMAIAGGIDPLTNGYYGFDPSTRDLDPLKVPLFDPHDGDFDLYGDAGGAGLYIPKEDGLFVSVPFEQSERETHYRFENDGNISAIASEAAARILSKEEFRGIELIIVEHIQGDKGDVVPPISNIVQYNLAKDFDIVERGVKGEKYTENLFTFAFDILSEQADGSTANLVADAYLRNNEVQTALVISVSPDGYVHAHYKHRIKGSDLPEPSVGVLKSLRQTDGYKKGFICMGPSYNPNFNRFHHFHIDGGAIYEDAVPRMSEFLEKLSQDGFYTSSEQGRERKPFDLDDIAGIVLHQMNLKMIEGGLQRFVKMFSSLSGTDALMYFKQFMEHKVPLTVDYASNTSAGSNSFVTNQFIKGKHEERDIDFVSSIFKKKMIPSFHVHKDNYRWLPGQIMLNVTAGASMNYHAQAVRIPEELLLFHNPAYPFPLNVRT